MKENITVDSQEIAHFSAMADAWWDPQGKFRPLHQMNPVRLDFIRDRIVMEMGAESAELPLSGKRILDIGCGGGLVCEPLAKLGAEMTGIDAAEKNIHIASLHAEGEGVKVDYRHMTAEALVQTGAQYDVVLALEIIEHVADVEAFIEAATALVRPGGLVFFSTLNRTWKSYAMAIVGAEYLLRWLPVGTHHWSKFLKPSEIILPLERNGVKTSELTGLVYEPISGAWSTDPARLDVNYILAGQKLPEQS